MDPPEEVEAGALTGVLEQPERSITETARDSEPRSRTRRAVVTRQLREWRSPRAGACEPSWRATAEASSVLHSLVGVFFGRVLQENVSGQWGTWSPVERFSAAGGLSIVSTSGVALRRESVGRRYGPHGVGRNQGGVLEHQRGEYPRPTVPAHGCCRWGDIGGSAPGGLRDRPRRGGSAGSASSRGEGCQSGGPACYSVSAGSGGVVSERPGGLERAGEPPARGQRPPTE